MTHDFKAALEKMRTTTWVEDNDIYDHIETIDAALELAIKMQGLSEPIEIPKEVYHATFSSQPSKPDINTCPECGGVADNGFDRCDPPSPYVCTKCQPSTTENKQ